MAELRTGSTFGIHLTVMVICSVLVFSSLVPFVSASPTNMTMVGCGFDFKKYCKSACLNIHIAEFGYCGERITFTDFQLGLTELTISLGSIFDVGPHSTLKNDLLNLHDSSHSRLHFLMFISKVDITLLLRPLRSSKPFC